MNEETICDLEVAMILRKQYRNDLIKNFLMQLISKKQKTNNHYSDLQLLADVSIYYQEIKNTINLADQTLEKINKILELNRWDNSDINNILNLNWKEIEEITTENIINKEKINKNITTENIINAKEINKLLTGYTVNYHYHHQQLII